MLADPLVYMVSSTKRVDRLIRATMSRFKHSSRCVAFANGISGILAATRPDQSCDETWKSHLQQRNASLKSYAHRRNLEQLKKELIDRSTVPHWLMVGSVYLSISEKFGFVCAMLAQMKSLFPDTRVIGANVRMCCNMQEQITPLALTGAPVK